MIQSVSGSVSIAPEDLPFLRRNMAMNSRHLSNKERLAKMPNDNLPPDVHRVKSSLANGSVIHYFSLRGRKGSGFYKSEKRLPRDREFYDAYAAKTKEMMPKASGLLTEDLIESYYRSAAYIRLWTH